LDNGTLFLRTGTDTVAWVIATFLFNMVRYPAVYGRVRAEIDNAFDKLGLTEETLTSEACDEKLPYFNMALKESMRFTPSVHGTSGRAMKKDLTLAGYHIPAHRDIKVSGFSLAEYMKNPIDWGATALQFDPERFQPDVAKQRSNFAFIPFGAGTRMCLGRVLADEELKTILPLILRCFDFKLHESQRAEQVEWRPVASALMATGDLKFCFTSRSH